MDMRRFKKGNVSVFRERKDKWEMIKYYYILEKQTNKSYKRILKKDNGSISLKVLAASLTKRNTLSLFLSW